MRTTPAHYDEPSSLNVQDQWQITHAITHYAKAGDLSIYYLIDMDDSLILLGPTKKTRQVVLNPALVHYLTTTLMTLPENVATPHYDIVSARSDDHFIKDVHLKTASALLLLIHVVNQDLAAQGSNRRLPPIENWGIYCLQDPSNELPYAGKRILSCRHQQNPRQPLAWALRSKLPEDGVTDHAVYEAMLADMPDSRENYFFKNYQLIKNDKCNKSQFLSRTLFPERAKKTPNFLCIMIDDSETQLRAITSLTPKYKRRILGIQVAPSEYRLSLARVNQFTFYQLPRQIPEPTPASPPTIALPVPTQAKHNKETAKPIKDCGCRMM